MDDLSLLGRTLALLLKLTLNAELVPDDEELRRERDAHARVLQVPALHDGLARIAGHRLDRQVGRMCKQAP